MSDPRHDMRDGIYKQRLNLGVPEALQVREDGLTAYCEGSSHSFNAGMDSELIESNRVGNESISNSGPWQHYWKHDFSSASQELVRGVYETCLGIKLVSDHPFSRRH